MSTVFDSVGNRLTLGRKLAEGGEGAIYEVEERPDLVAKLYLQKPDRDRVTKLRAMSSVSNADLLKIAAWPIATLTAKNGGETVGFTMPRVAGREAHVLYSPKQRQAEFPNVDWRFLIWAARNVAAAVSTVHAGGHVIGDINQKGFLVSPNATVRLIDCDSFQVVALGKTHPCVVGVPEFTPPELHGQSFERVVRTENHDAFGLAVLVFQILFMGRHPFAGRFLGRGDMPPDRAIREFRFAYSQNAATREILPPPHALPLSSVSFGVANLFERAFAPAGTHGARPFARDWVTALERLARELKGCDVDPAHRFHSSLPGCAWCTVERGGGPAFFISASASLQAGAGGTFDFQKIWAAITAIASPSVPPDSPAASASVSVVPNGIPKDLVTRRHISRIGFALSAVGTVLGLTSVLPNWAFVAAGSLTIVALLLRYSTAWQEERARRKTALDAAQRQWAQMVESWRREARQPVDTFIQRRRELEQFAVEYKALPQRLQSERDALNRRREELQRKAFLEKYYVRDAKLEGIGPGLKNVLISYGIETAEDVGRAARVPGFGPSRLSTLLAWRRGVEARFRFDASQAISPADVAALNHKFALRRKEIERFLVTGKRELEDLRRRADQLRSGAADRFKGASRQLAQATADYKLVT